jgi:TRAP-type C4-dicarboxylate transport system permease large subunit
VTGIEKVFLWIGAEFTGNVYLSASKFQGILWSLADIVLIYAFLRIVDFARANFQRKRVVFRYVFLALSALLTPFLIVSETPKAFFSLECIICGVQFSILLYSAVAERKRLFQTFKDIMDRCRPESL